MTILSVPRVTAAFTATLLCLVRFPSTVVGQTTDSCTLCPAGSTMGAPDKGLFSDDPMLPDSCGGIDAALELLPLIGETCETTLPDLLSPVDLRVYCECSGVDPPALACDLCEGGALVENTDVTSPILNGFTCGQFNDIVASLVLEEECQGAKGAAVICCEGGLGPNITLPDDDNWMGGGDNGTEIPNVDDILDDLIDDDNATSNGNSTTNPNTMPPTMVNTTDDDDSGNVTTVSCQVCADGSTPTNTDLEIPTFQLSCSTLQNLPTEVCDTVKASIAIGALCGCPGEEAPNNCPLCSGGGTLTESTETVNVGGGLSLSCQEAELFANYASELVCQASIEAIDSVCCQGIDTEVTAEPTTAPTPALETPTASETTDTPTATGGVDDSASAKTHVAGTVLVTIVAAAAALM